MPLSPRREPPQQEAADELQLFLLRGRFAICQLPPGTPIPDPPPLAQLWSLTRTEGEVSLVLPEEFAERRWRVESGYRCLVVQGPLPFSAVGILARLSGALADAGVPLFALSTFDTDYLLVPDEQLPAAIDALQGRGCRVV
jgi:hypothetical protein